MHPRVRLLTIGVAVLAVAACVSDIEEASREESGVVRDQAIVATAAPGGSDAQVASFSGSGSAPPMSAAVAGKLASRSPAQSVSPASLGMIIRTGHVTARVDSLEPAVAALRALAASLEGHVGNVTVNVGAHEVQQAALELRVPAARFDEAMSGIRPVGRIEHSAVSVQDVGEEFVDVTARLTNARRLETRLLELLANRTGKLEEVLAAERELARVREEIERYEGRLRFLNSRVVTSSIHVLLAERPPLVAAHPGSSVIGQAVLNMWRNFVRLVATIIEGSGVVAPIALVLWLVWRRTRFSWRKRAVAA